MTILLLDAAFVAVSFWLSYFVRSEFQLPIVYKKYFYSGILPTVAIQALIFWGMGTHRMSLMRITFEDAVKLLASICLGTALCGLSLWVAHGFNYPRSIFVLYPLILSGFVISTRFLGRVYHEHRARKRQRVKPRPPFRKTIVIAGAGTSGIQLVRSLRHHDHIRILGFLDDDPLLQGKEVCNLPILGTSAEVAALADRHRIQEIVIAMPSASGETIKRMVKLFRPLGIPIKTLPNLRDFVEGKNPAAQLRQINLEDLLRRDPVILDMSQIKRDLADKCVLVTGAAGSIGSELCRQILEFKPRELVMLDIAESPLYEIDCELRERHRGATLAPHLLDIKDQTLLNDILNRHKPSTVFHAAAYKHVPLLETNPVSGVVNNVSGGKSIADLACANGVDKFILVSTDKAVNPTSVMGATKRVLERYYQFLNANSGTRFIAVRFGNVLGSKGSLIPIFERQIRQGGPLTVTHPDIVRYFMTIPEATQLVLQASSMGQGGEIFVLDMGEPIKIIDLARDFIELHGFEVGKDVDIELTGLRPGEKLFEELFGSQEDRVKTAHPKILMAKHPEPAQGVDSLVDDLIAQALAHEPELFSTLARIVPEFRRDPQIGPTRGTP